MELRGWDYVGRNIDKSLHSQFSVIVDCLSDKTFAAGRSWGREVQEELAIKLGTSAGQIRTIKRVCEDLGLIKRGSLNGKEPILHSNIITNAGEIVLKAYKLEQFWESNGDSQKLKEALDHIRGIYEEGYIIALVGYYFDLPTNPPTRLHPFRAMLKAFKKYGSLDKWEWYLLNTDIRADDDPQMELLLDQHIKEYRLGAFHLSMENIVEKPKGHQYLPQFFEYAGLVDLIKGRHWQISDNHKHIDIKSHVLSDGFLSELY